jgi:DNA-binding transcriptional LysR family regulator
VRLLTRTTRNVSTTEAGERLLRTIGPHFDEVRREVERLSELRDKPSGTIRITSADHPAEAILWPRLERLLPQYPDIHVEISVDDTLRDLAG